MTCKLEAIFSSLRLYFLMKKLHPSTNDDDAGTVGRNRKSTQSGAI